MGVGHTRALLTPVLLAVIVFAAGGVAGFIYGHEPQRDTLELHFEQPTDGDRAAERSLSGTLRAVAPSRITLSTVEGDVTLELPPATPLDELRALPADELRPGMRVNVGVERGAFGLILTGVVAVEGGP